MNLSTAQWTLTDAWDPIAAKRPAHNDGDRYPSERATASRDAVALEDSIGD
jgi:hypothetical protein